LPDNIILLLVDDEAMILHLLEDALTEAGYTVVSAIDGEEAIAELNNPANQLAGLITDIRMGDGANGWDVARHARKLAPTFPVVYMTGDGAADWASQGVPNSTLVQKPFATAQVITAISTLLNEAATTSAGS
jgi:two-component system cell cycle response regulator CpdR